MKRLLLLMGLLLVVSCGGGGDDGGGSAAVSSANPTLTWVDYTSNVEVSIDAYVEFGFSDPEGDISTLFVTEKFGTKIIPHQYSAKDMLISGNQGSSYFTIAYPTDASIGQHDYEIWLVDAKGNSSNLLTLTITVSAATDIPSILVWDYPATVKVGQNARIDFGYSDTGGDISWFYISEVYAGVLAPIYNAIPAQSLLISGKSGFAYITRTGQANDQVGKHDFTIWLKDSKGNISKSVTITIYLQLISMRFY